MKVSFKKKAEKQKGDMIPTKFKRFVEKKKRRLNDLTPESKVIALLSKALAMQGQKDKANYYIAGDEIWCPELNVTKGRGGSSYRASGRFKMGSYKENLTFSMMKFSITFRDSKDEMGLPDLAIEEVSMEELPKSTKLKE